MFEGLDPTIVLGKKSASWAMTAANQLMVEPFSKELKDLGGGLVSPDQLQLHWFHQWHPHDPEVQDLHEFPFVSKEVVCKI